MLIASRPKGKALERLWEFPRRQDRHERPEEALIRELGEELGITVKAACLAPLTFAKSQTLKWVWPKDLRHYPMPPADASLIPHFVDLLT